MNRSKFDGKVIAVTGASSGVGLAIVRELARRGARLGLIARGEEGLEAAAHEVAELGGAALGLPADVADSAAVFDAARQLAAQWGRIDFWVNCAMVSVLGPVDEIEPAEYRRVMEVNYLGYVHGTLAALSHMRPVDRGTIVQIGSALAYRSVPLQSAYCASKAGLRAFTDSLHSELAHDRSHIKVTTVHLPAVNTPQFEVMRNKLPAHPRPVGPVYQPEVVAKAVLYAMLHPRREYWVGGSTATAILAQKFIPGVLDRYLGRTTWDRQQTTKFRLRHHDNLDAPLPGARGAHGKFDDEARNWSAAVWARTHLGPIAGVGAALLTAGGLFWATRRRSSP